MVTVLPSHVLAALLTGALSFGGAQSDSVVFSAGFGPGWEDRWRVERLDARATTFSVEEESGDSILRSDSDAGAAALWQPLQLDAEGLSFAWRWKVASALPDNHRERERAGDDYAARVFVIFDGTPFSREARAICYVWASGEPPRSVYPNPYISSVMTVVLRSGNDRAGSWVMEERDVAADYEMAFGVSPGRVSGLAVMADADDTGLAATAWFDDLQLTVASGPDGGAGETGPVPFP